MGNWRVNLAIAGIGSILVLLISVSNNTFLESLLRTLYSFIAFAVIVYVMRFIFNSFIISKPVKENTAEDTLDETNSQSIDLQAYDENENLQNLLKQQLSQSQISGGKAQVNQTEEDKTAVESFKPLKPTELFTNKKVQPEEMSKAIRHLTGE